MHFHQVQPHRILAPYVQYYWAMKSDSHTLPALDYGVIPGGYLDIVFNLGDRVCFSDSGRTFFDEARSFVAGPFDHFQRFHFQGQLDSLGVRFHLGKTAFLSSLQLRAIRNRAVPLETAWGDQWLRVELQALERRLS